MAREVPRMMRVERKSRAESTKDATREMDDDDRTARPFETRRIMLMAKLTTMNRMISHTRLPRRTL
jgi:hypothetical protein